MKLIKFILICVVLIFLVIFYLFNKSKIVSYKGITIKVPFVSQKVRTDSSLMVLKYPLNGTSLFFGDTKMSKDEFLGPYMANIVDHNSSIEKKVLRIDKYDLYVLESKTKLSKFERIQILIPDKNVILKIAGNEDDIKKLMGVILEMSFNK